MTLTHVALGWRQLDRVARRRLMHGACARVLGGPEAELLVWVHGWGRDSVLMVEVQLYHADAHVFKFAPIGPHWAAQTHACIMCGRGGRARSGGGGVR